MVLNTLQIVMWSTFGILGFLILMTYVYPRYILKPTGGFIKQPLHRPPSVIIDRAAPGVICEIEERGNFDNGTVTLKLRNKNGSFIRNYNVDDILPLDTTQTMVDTEAPMFITLDTVLSHTEVRNQFKEYQENLRRRIAECDSLKVELNSLKANMHIQVDTQVKRILELNKVNRPDWNNANK